MSRPAAIVLAVLLSAAWGPAISPHPPHGGAEAKVEPRVIRELANGGSATFWVVMRPQADLRAAPSILDWTARGEYVVDRLRGVARTSQAGLRSYLDGVGVSYTSYWIVNALRVTAGGAVVDAIAARDDVSRILASRRYRISEWTHGAGVLTARNVEWNIERIGAPKVWKTFHDRGQGIVVANIDTGVQWDHPALIAQYRGSKRTGVNHNYSWFDPSNVCGDPSVEPCDNVGHGTHTMGTLVGDDGGANEIGVAPRAKWIAAKGCEDVSCSLTALLASGQWMLAPTDLQGSHPRVDKRPDVVSNSWGGAGDDIFYRSTVQAWVASGIFPVFSNGGSGPACGTVAAPASYQESYGVGAFDMNDAIASFSSRGPSPFRSKIKPNIAAPGVNIRSSVPGGYSVFSGTSMATPHVAGTVALVWSAHPSLRRDIAGTRAVLDDSAADVSNLQCGGSADDNNVWGEGRLDAFAAVSLPPDVARAA